MNIEERNEAKDGVGRKEVRQIGMEKERKEVRLNI